MSDVMKDRAERAEAAFAKLQKSQPYRYIGRDGKAVLARELEDQIEALQAQLATANQRAEMLATARAEGYADGLLAAIAACEKVKAESRGYHLPEMAMGAAKCIEDLTALIPATPAEPAQVTVQKTYQTCVDDWVLACFGPIIRMDGVERNHRFLEEAIELVQSLGCTKSEAMQLVDYVYGRDIGDPHQEVGGVMNTLAALCTAHGLDMTECGEVELSRVWTKVEVIRAKQAAKPKYSPLPQHVIAGDKL